MPMLHTERAAHPASCLGLLDMMWHELSSTHCLMLQSQLSPHFCVAASTAVTPASVSSNSQQTAASSSWQAPQQGLVHPNPVTEPARVDGRSHRPNM